jgi:hypothetical protein
MPHEQRRDIERQIERCCAIQQERRERTCRHGRQLSGACHCGNDGDRRDRNDFGVYVNAGVTHPSETWLDGLSDGGR